MIPTRFTTTHQGQQVEVVPAALFDAVVRRARFDVDVLTLAVELGSAVVEAGPAAFSDTRGETHDA